MMAIRSKFHTLQRVARHRWLDAGDSHRALGNDGLHRLQTLVAASEQTHSGEIRVCVEAGLPWSYLWRGATPRERAVTMFGKLRVWDTEHNNGVLIYLLLADRRIEVITDRGLNPHVSAEQWMAMTAAMSAAFQAGRFTEGLALAIDEAHRLLSLHFPLAQGEAHANELPDAVVLR